MAATDLPIITPVGPYPALPVAALALDIAFTAADVANGNAFVATGKEILLMHNADASSHNVTLTSQPINGRTGDIANYALGAGLYAAFEFSSTAGWLESDDGRIHISADNAQVEFAVIRR